MNEQITEQEIKGKEICDLLDELKVKLNRFIEISPPLKYPTMRIEPTTTVKYRKGHYYTTIKDKRHLVKKAVGRGLTKELSLNRAKYSWAANVIVKVIEAMK